MCVCVCVCVSVCVSVCRERFIFKELAHVIVEGGKSKICRAGWRPQEALMLQFEAKDRLQPHSPFLQGISLFLISFPLFNRLTEAHKHSGG